MPQDRRFTDDLPSINISRLRAMDVITPETTEFMVKLGDVEQTIAVYLRNFPNGGSWSLFIAPCCGKKVRVLRLLNGHLLCCRCCRARGMLYRSDPTSPRRRAALRIPKLRAMLESDKPLRLKPSTMRGKMERRERHEAALQRNLLILRRLELAELGKAMGKAKD